MRAQNNAEASNLHGLHRQTHVGMCSLEPGCVARAEAFINSRVRTHATNSTCTHAAGMPAPMAASLRSERPSTT